MVLRSRRSFFAVAAIAAFMAEVAYAQEERGALSIDIPSGGGGGTGSLIVYGGDNRKSRLYDAAAGPVQLPDLWYGEALVRFGRRSKRVAIGKKLIFAIPADPEKLQVWTVDDEPVVIGIVPGETLTIRSGGYESFWEISSVRLNPLRGGPPGVCCTKDEDECPAGYVYVDGSSSDDAFCRSEGKRLLGWKRCMVPGAIRVAVERDMYVAIVDSHGGERKGWNAHAGEVSDYVVASSGETAHWKLTVGEEYYLLVIGPGEKWTLNVKADGSVSGVRDRASLTTKLPNKALNATVGRGRPPAR